jgi:tRNA pseudouridine32 synthase / 23S rRNA pseudouridine746 synthase
MTSRLYLHRFESPPATILEYLIARFPHISEATWRDRLRRGVVMLDDGTAVTEGSPYRDGLMVLYDREVPAEPLSMESEIIVYRDDKIIVADKPHGMPVTPAGDYVARSLLVRLQRSTEFTTLAPMHRLDRDTAGLVLFTIEAAHRARYHEMFARGIIEREYVALAEVREKPDRTTWRVETRLGAGDPWYRRRIVDGFTNAVTNIELVELRDEVGRFRIRPETGKKHQIRVHMCSIGYPILGDSLYPTIKDSGSALQLLAKKLSFTDPFEGCPRTFTSDRVLMS